MSSINTKSSLRLTVIGITMVLLAGGTFADKRCWAGEGKDKEGKDHRGGEGTWR